MGLLELMQTIWKTVLESTDVQTITIPKEHEFLGVHEQDNKVCLWYRCNTSSAPEDVIITIVGTGLDATLAGNYIGTAYLWHGSLVLHVFVN